MTVPSCWHRRRGAGGAPRTGAPGRPRGATPMSLQRRRPQLVPDPRLPPARPASAPPPRTARLPPRHALRARRCRRAADECGVQELFPEGTTDDTCSPTRLSVRWLVNETLLSVQEPRILDQPGEMPPPPRRPRGLSPGRARPRRTTQSCGKIKLSSFAWNPGCPFSPKDGIG